MDVRQFGQLATLANSSIRPMWLDMCRLVARQLAPMSRLQVLLALAGRFDCRHSNQLHDDNSQAICNSWTHP